MLINAVVAAISELYMDWRWSRSWSRGQHCDHGFGIDVDVLEVLGEAFTRHDIIELCPPVRHDGPVALVQEPVGLFPVVRRDEMGLDVDDQLVPAQRLDSGRLGVHSVLGDLEEVRPPFLIEGAQPDRSAAVSTSPLTRRADRPGRPS